MSKAPPAPSEQTSRPRFRPLPKPDKLVELARFSLLHNLSILLISPLFFSRSLRGMCKAINATDKKVADKKNN